MTKTLNYRTFKIASEQAKRIVNVEGVQLDTVLDEIEQDIITAVYIMCGNNQSEAARRLGVSRTALIYKLKRYGVLERDQPGSDRSCDHDYQAPITQY